MPTATAAATKSRQSCPTLCNPIDQQAPLSRGSPGKNTGVGCHFLLQGMKVKSESEVTQLCSTLVTPWTVAFQAPPSMILQARVLEWVAIAFSNRMPRKDLNFR